MLSQWNDPYCDLLQISEAKIVNYFGTVALILRQPHYILNQLGFVKSTSYRYFLAFIIGQVNQPAAVGWLVNSIHSALDVLSRISRLRRRGIGISSENKWTIEWAIPAYWHLQSMCRPRTSFFESSFGCTTYFLFRIALYALSSISFWFLGKDL